MALLEKKILLYRQSKDAYRDYSKAEMTRMLEDHCMTLISSIADTNCQHGFTRANILRITNVNIQAPEAFRDRFYFIMDMLYPIRTFVMLYINRYHPEDLEYVRWLYDLYNEEAVLVKKS